MKKRLIHDWNLGGKVFKPSKPVWFDDETLRDGLQSPSVRNPDIDEKLRILRLMDRLGVQRVDLGLPGAGPRHREHIEAMLRVITEERLSIRPGCAVRTMQCDIEPIVELQQRYRLPIQASMFLGTSPIRKFVEGWTTARLLESCESAVKFAVSHELPVMFVTEDTTRSSPAEIRTIYTRAIELGARAICVADTVGHATPRGVKRLLGFVRRVIDATGVEGVKINWHGHRDRCLSIANCLAAVEAGADVIHGTALGIGERAGNAPMDLLLVNMKLLGWIENDLSCLAEYVQVCSQALEVQLSRNYPVFGEDAFETATGVHAAAIIKAFRKGDPELADAVYSGVPAGRFGLHQKIRVGHMSGRSNVVFWLESHHIEPQPGLVEKILEAAKFSARLLRDDEILAVIAAHGGAPEPAGQP
ncbi:MAG: 2-isopropylmalate synthase [Candidatus Wallbacteria bacterium]|nr:2-isopropylmalate synthase [Candidatus Wallbacteria bacterium]